MTRFRCARLKLVSPVPAPAPALAPGPAPAPASAHSNSAHISRVDLFDSPLDHHDIPINDSYDHDSNESCIVLLDNQTHKKPIIQTQKVVHVPNHNMHHDSEMTLDLHDISSITVQNETLSMQKEKENSELHFTLESSTQSSITPYQGQRKIKSPTECTGTSESLRKRQKMTLQEMHDQHDQEYEAYKARRYLDGWRIVIVGFDRPKMRELIAAVRAGFGTRFSRFDEHRKGVNCIVAPSKAWFQQNYKMRQKNRVVSLVSSEWLLECTRKKCALPLSDYLLTDNASYTVNKHDLFASDAAARRELPLRRTQSLGLISMQRGTSTNDTILNDTPEPEKNQQPRMSGISKHNHQSLKSVFNQVQKESFQKRCAVNSSAVVANKIRLLANTAVSTSNSGIVRRKHGVNVGIDATGPFAGLYFITFLAKDVEFNLMPRIRKLDGTIVDSLGQANYIVVERFHQTAATKLAAGQTLVTIEWVDECERANRLLSTEHSMLFTPLPELIAIPDFQGTSICSTGFKGKELELVQRCVESTGATYTASFKRTNTVLITEKSMHGPSQKLHAACQWGIPIVTANWLIDCLKSCRMLNTTAYEQTAPSSPSVPSSAQAQAQAIACSSAVVPDDSTIELATNFQRTVSAAIEQSRGNR